MKSTRIHFSPDREPDPDHAAMVERNEWFERHQLDEVLAVIKELTKSGKEWTWARNTQCKYIDIRIDMRDGGFVLKDRSGRISLKQLLWQYSSKEGENL